MSDHEYQDDTFSEYASDDTYEIVSRGSAYSHSDEEVEHEEEDVLPSVTETSSQARSEVKDNCDVMHDESSGLDVEHDLRTVKNSSVGQCNRRSSVFEGAGLLGHGTTSKVLDDSYIEAGGMQSSQELEADVGQQLSTPTIVHSIIEESTDERVVMVDRGMLFEELPIKDEPITTLGIHALDLPIFTSQYGQNKLTVKMPMNKEKLTLRRPFRLLYCGLPEHQQRVVDKLTQALSLSSTETTIETLLETHGCKAFIEIYTSQSKPMELCIMSMKSDEMLGSGRVDHPTIFLHDDDVRITKYWMPDLAIVIQEEWGFESVLFKSDEIRKQNVPIIELWMTQPENMWRNQPCDEEAVHLVVQHGNAPVNSSLEEEARKILHSPKKVGLDMATFESIDAEQLNRHIAHLQRKSKESRRLGVKTPAPYVLTRYLHVALATLTNAGESFKVSAKAVAEHLKLAGQATHPSVLKQSTTPSEEEMQSLFKLFVGCLISLSVLHTLTWVLLPLDAGTASNIARSLPIRRPVVSMFASDPTLSSNPGSSTFTITSTLTSRVTSTATSRINSVRFASSVPTSTQLCTKAIQESTLGDAIADIITGHKLGDSAVAEWFDFRAPKKVRPNDKQAKHTRSCHNSEEGLLANWTLKGDEETFIVTTDTKPTWRQKLQQPLLVAVNSSGLCRTVALVPVNPSTYSVKLNAEELDGDGVLIMGHALSGGYLLQRHSINRYVFSRKDLQTHGNLTELAIHVMKQLQSERIGTAPAMSHLYYGIQDAISGVKSRVQRIAVEAGGSTKSARKQLKSLTNVEEWTSTFGDWSQTYRHSMPDAKQMSKALRARIPTIRKKQGDFKTAAKAVQDQSMSAAEKIQRDAFTAVRQASKRAREVSDQVQGANHRVQGLLGATLQRAAGARAWMGREGV